MESTEKREREGLAKLKTGGRRKEKERLIRIYRPVERK
jgi:hypothetical protein